MTAEFQDNQGLLIFISRRGQLVVILLIKNNYNFFRSSIIVTFNRLLFLFLLIKELANSD